MKASVDLDNCDREPIHVPGAIQPHGMLLACRGEQLRVTQVSDNVADHLGVGATGILETSLLSHLSTESIAVLDDASRAGFPRESNPLPVEDQLGRAFDAIVHRSATPDVVVVEFEPRHAEGAGWDPRMRSAIRRLQDATDKRSLAEIAAREVRSLTGFDRVMVYRFDQDWNGQVVAEAKRDDLETFLGLHYPAADIPAQARRLYTLNWLRIIPDVGYRPSPLVPVRDPVTGQALDLSFSVLRSVSPVHLEYLRNMRVTASMSVSLIHGGRLIGLIACHHYDGPHYVPFITRETVEYLGQVVSWHLDRLEAEHAAVRAVTTHRAQARLMSAIATASTIPEGLLDPAILDLTDAAGACLVYEGQVHEIGQTPGTLRVRRLVHELADPSRARVFVTDRLADHLPDAAAWDDSAAGVLAVDISRDLGEFIIWFRPSTERTVDWAGDPRKHQTVVDPATGVPRLSPRGSFELWRETVRGRSLPWELWQVEAASSLRTLLLGKFRQRAAELRDMNDRLSAADRAKDEFLATISHELRTPLNGMLGWVKVMQGVTLTEDQRERALVTIERNARSQAKLIDDLLDVGRIMSGKLKLNVETVLLAGVVEQCIDTVRPAADAKDIRIQSTLDSTGAIMGDPQRLQQVVTNLLTNAVKFTPRNGRVQVCVERRDSSVDFSVADTGQGIDPEFMPHVFERFRQGDTGAARRAGGLGLGLAIVRSIVEMHGGSVSAQSDGPGRGATFTVRLPLSVALRRGLSASVSPAEVQDSMACPPQLAGLRILVVDDEPDARELLHALFSRCRAIVATAASAPEALGVLEFFTPDVIVSDIGLPEMDGYAFIAEVRSRPPHLGGRAPAVALTAYARVEDRTRALFGGFQSHVPKPVEPMEILAVVASLASVSRHAG